MQPAGVVVARIAPVTGLLSAPGSEGIEEVFLDGTAPTESAAAPGEEANPDQKCRQGARAVDARGGRGSRTGFTPMDSPMRKAA
jgi:hypothetical protein